MTSVATSSPRSRPEPAARPVPADVLVIFGITGDLAKVMTLRSLYRLERRGLLDCPIVGVAVDDWGLDDLVERARTSIVATGEDLDEEVFGRLAGRFSYVPGDFGELIHETLRQYANDPAMQECVDAAATAHWLDDAVVRLWRARFGARPLLSI